jgi:hypothetical protein
MKTTINSNDSWTNGHRFGAVIGIWFGANLLFQSLWLGLHGQPFDAAILLEFMGPFASLMIIVELVFWIVILTWLGRRMIRSRTSNVNRLSE